jgi:hypothetical protein
MFLDLSMEYLDTYFCAVISELQIFEVSIIVVADRLCLSLCKKGKKIDMAEFDHPLNTEDVDDYVYMLVNFFSCHHYLYSFKMSV